MDLYINKNKLRIASIVYVLGVAIMIFSLPYSLWLQSTIEGYEPSDWVIRRLILLFIAGFIPAAAACIWKANAFRCPNCQKRFLRGPLFFSNPPRYCSKCGTEIEIRYQKD